LLKKSVKRDFSAANGAEILRFEPLLYAFRMVFVEACEGDQLLAFFILALADTTLGVVFGDFIA